MQIQEDRVYVARCGVHVRTLPGKVVDYGSDDQDGLVHGIILFRDEDGTPGHTSGCWRRKDGTCAFPRRDDIQLELVREELCFFLRVGATYELRNGHKAVCVKNESGKDHIRAVLGGWQGDTTWKLYNTDTDEVIRVNGFGTFLGGEQDGSFNDFDVVKERGTTME